MAPRAEGLSARKVETIREPGLHGDGGGLYLQVTKNGAKSWIFRFKLGDKRRDMGLGPLSVFTLAEARDRAVQARKLVMMGIDPIGARDKPIMEAKIAAAQATTFFQAAKAYIESHKAGWRNEKHGDQWTNTLATYAGPVFGHLPIGAVDTNLIMKVLDPIWSTKPETAGRVRGRIESVIDWATARGFRTGENPARWRGHLQSLLPSRSKVARVEHHAALPYSQLANFMTRLRVTDGMSARAMRFLILTAARSGEVLGAKWSEIDLEARQWTIPAERMKAGREHRVPLSEAAASILRDVAAIRSGDFIFGGAVADKGLSNMALTMVLRRLKREDITVHGFRSTFRDWCAEKTDFPSEVAEMALAHAVGDKVEAAYRRGDLLEKRRQLVDAWATYCETPAAQ